MCSHPVKTTEPDKVITPYTLYSTQTHTHSTISLPWDFHAIILCNIKVSSAEGSQVQLEAAL